MEDASKALLIAAGVFFVLLIVSLMVVVYNDISAYYENKHNLTVIEQAQEFNSKFESYNRNNLRGSELISFMNRVIDYNASEAYNEDKNYERIRVTITLGGQEIRNQFKYEIEGYSASQNKYLNKDVITNTSGGGNKWANDRQLTEITNTSMEMCNELQSLGCTKVTDSKLQQLASKITNIIVDENDVKSTTAIYNRFKRADILEDVLGIKIGDTPDCLVDIDEDTGRTKRGQNIINKIKDIANQYYQYVYFKSAHFDCTEVIYNPDTSRVIEMNFKLQTKLVNGIETVVFD